MNHSPLTFVRDKKEFSITHASFVPHSNLSPSSTTPSARYSHTTSYHGKYLYMYGGSGENKKVIPAEDNFYRMTLQSRKWEKLDITPCPPPRQHHAAVVVSHFLYIFGGASLPNVYDDLWVFNFNSMEWKKIEIKVRPQARYNSSLFVLHNKCLLLFGGIDSSHIVCNNSFLFDFENMKWIELTNTGEDCSRCFPATLCSESGRIFMFGGGRNALMNGNLSKDLIELIVDTNHLELKTLKLIPAKDNTINPPGMIHHAMIELGNNLLIFGGMTEIKQKGIVSTDDIWLFKRRTAVWETFKIKNFTPSAKGSVSKTDKDAIFLFGGQVDLPDIQEVANQAEKDVIRLHLQAFPENKSITNKLYKVSNTLSSITFPEIQKEGVEDEDIRVMEVTNPVPVSMPIAPIIAPIRNLPLTTIPTAEVFKVDEVLTSISFIGQIAKLQKHPFPALAHVVDCANLKKATFLRISQQFNKRQGDNSHQIRSFFYRFNFDGEILQLSEFFASTYSVLRLPPQYTHTKQDIEFGNKLKLGGFRLGRIILLVYRDKNFRQVALHSLESKIVPSSETNFKALFYVEDIKTGSILNNSGKLYKSFIQNFLRTQEGAANCLNLELMNGTTANYDFYIFEPNRIITNEGIQSLELNFLKNGDVFPLVNMKKIEFLDNIGYKISSQPDFSLRTYLGLLYLEPRECRVFIGENNEPVAHIEYEKILEQHQKSSLLSPLKFDLAPKECSNTNHIISISTFAIKDENVYIHNNYGFLMYASGRLVKRFDIGLGELFERRFYKNKYRFQLINLHKYMGILNIDSHLCKLDLLESDFEDNRLSVTTWKNIKFYLKTEEAKIRPLSEKKSVLLGLGKDELLKEMSA